MSQRTRWVGMGLFLLVLPVGVRVDENNPSQLTISAHGGTGQVASIVRDCSGNVIDSTTNTYTDVAASAQVAFRMESDVTNVLGIRAGSLHSDARFPGGGGPQPETEVEYTYWNPYMAIEGRKVGFGLGYLAGTVPFGFDDWSEETELPMSGHLRFGDLDRKFFMISLHENLPLASGGGYFDLGVGYPGGERTRLFTGISAGFYDGGGIMQQVRFPMAGGFEADLSGRWGQSGGEFEASIALGVLYRLPTGR